MFSKQPSSISTFNNSLGSTPKVDPVIIYALMKLTNISAEPYSNQTERKYKYYQMRDMIQTTITPFLVPKVSRHEWARRYFILTKRLEESTKLEQNLDYFQYILGQYMQLLSVILYSNNYYLLENFTDTDYKELMASGGEVHGA
jgi:hypothetical protein